MRTIFKTVILMAPLLALAAAPALAEGTPSAELSWADCVKEALGNSPVLKAKRLAVDQSEYQYRDQLNVYYPKVNLSHSFSHSGGDSSATSSRWGLSLSASESLWNVGNSASVRSARLGYEQAKASYRDESAALRQTLYSAFVSLVVAQDQVKVDKKVLDIRKQNADLIKLKYDSGRESRGNMMYSEALFQQAKASAQKSERSLASARRALLASMGAAASREVTAKGDLATPAYRLNEAGLAAALENIPQVVSQRKSVEKYKESLVSAKGDIYPTLSASQSMGWSGPSEFPGSKSWSLGVSLNLPLLSGGLTHYTNNVKGINASLGAAEETLKNLKLTLESGIRTAYDDFLNACDSVTAGAVVVSANEERYKEAQINYMAGNISFIDLESVEQSMVDAQQNQLQYLKTANVKKISLENLLGVTLED